MEYPKPGEINICSLARSLAAQSHSPNRSIDGASKAAVEHLTRSMAHEWASYGINVNAINPGYIETDIKRARFSTTASVGACRHGRIHGPH
ncbi:SDR family NAD(P)-dependent oxidoreductase [Paraburkholderia tagetis]|uniref:SDR family NAD(P)-dependent oxidoreductase n=1 Tax=Paraburkholderia tagetis TaxID=2913261 RepID=UPI003B75C009